MDWSQMLNIKEVEGKTTILGLKIAMISTLLW